MYTKELVNELLKISKDSEIHLLNLYGTYENDLDLNEHCYLHEYMTGSKVIDVGERQLFCDERTMSIVEAEVKHFLQKSGIDVMLFTSPNEYGGMYKAEWFNGVFKVGILYDLIPLIFPKQCLFDKKYRQDYEKSLELLKEMDLLFAISQSAKDDAVKLLGIPENKIVVVYAGIDKDFRKKSYINVKAIKSKYYITDAFMMFAGGIDFKKNIDDIILAYSKLEKTIIKNYQLVITGKTNVELKAKFLDLAKSYNVDGRVICTGYIPKEDLIDLYNITELLIFPSLYEGFGLPVIEAMACGARVVTSDVSSLKEIADGYATLVNPKSVKSIKNGIEKVMMNPATSKDLAEKSIDYAKSFTWKRVAEKVMSSIVEKCPRRRQHIEYDFEITKKILEQIAYVYVDNGCPLVFEDMSKIVNDLLIIANHGEKKLKIFKNRIIYDMTVVSEWMKSGYNTGIGRVSVELFKELSKFENILPVVISKKQNKVHFDMISALTWEIVREDIEIRDNDIYFMPELQLRGIQVDKNHPHIKEIKSRNIRSYAIVFDILPLLMPQYFEKKTYKAFHSYIRDLVNDFDGLIGISKDVSNSVKKYCDEYDICSNDNKKVKIGYFHLGQNSLENIESGQISNQIVKFLDTLDDVYFMLGTIEPRKGHELVLQEFEKKWKDVDSDRLCIAGHIGWNMQQFVEKLKNHPENGKRLAFFEAVTDAEVKYIYEHSTVLIQASAGEGFGLPLIEAGHYNMPIICSDIPVFHEVAGDNVIYFNRDSIGALGLAIEQFKDMKSKDILPKSKNINVTTWEDAAKKVLKLIINDYGWEGKI